MESTNKQPTNVQHEKLTIFKCNKHTAIISEKLLSFYEQNELFDTELIAGSNNFVRIPAHRVVLCALSEYFLEIFRGDKKNSKKNVVELKEIEASTLKPIIEFMYKGSIELSLKTVKALLKTASVLKMKSLIAGCCELIEKNINFNNSLNWFQLAKELNLPILKAKSQECIYTNFKKILKKKELLMLSGNELMDLLFIDNSNERNHLGEQIFLSMVAWINFDKTNREHQVYEFLAMVRFKDLSPKFIVKHRKSVCRTVESYELICSWLQWHLLPETRSNDQPDSATKTIKKKRKKKKMKPDIIAVICREGRNVIVKTFNHDLDSWSTKIETRSADKLGFSAIVINNKLILAGGFTCGDNSANRVECLDLDTSEWITFPPMNTVRTNCQLANLNGHLCVFDVQYDTSPLEIYNFSTKEWHDLEPLSQLSGISEMATHNKMLYILDLENCFLHTYNVSSKKWTLKKIILDIHYENMRRDYFHMNFALVATEQFLYIIGGSYISADGCYERKCFSLYRYDLINNCWCELAYPRYLLICQQKIIVRKNKIIIICEEQELHEYDIETDTWKTLSPFSEVAYDECYLGLLK